MPRPPDTPFANAGQLVAPRRVHRFTRTERWVHRTTGLLMGVCMLTAACLYLPLLAEIAGRRRLVTIVHEWSGILTPAPVLLSLGSHALRADLRRLNRFGPHDHLWLRAVLRRDPRSKRPAGKFNAGQKVFAAWTVGVTLVMTATGLLLWFPGLAPLVWRTGASFVHDWLALAVAGVVIGHMWMAAQDPESRLGMRSGTVTRSWAAREHSLWQPREAGGHHGDGGSPGPQHRRPGASDRSSGTLRPPHRVTPLDPRQ